VEGKIKFSYPVIMLGKEVDGIYLEFKEGKVITARSEKGEDFLHSLLDIDENARYVGELGIGTNYNIKKFTKNLLFDEKIGGTIHIATGSAFPEAGGDNVSGVHVDMVCDMKKSGEIYADGELIYKQGKFINQP
jgi:aminopeptidase